MRGPSGAKVVGYIRDGGEHGPVESLIIHVPQESIPPARCTISFDANPESVSEAEKIINAIERVLMGESR